MDQLPSINTQRFKISQVRKDVAERFMLDTQLATSFPVSRRLRQRLREIDGNYLVLVPRTMSDQRIHRLYEGRLWIEFDAEYPDEAEDPQYDYLIKPYLVNAVIRDSQKLIVMEGLEPYGPSEAIHVGPGTWLKQCEQTPYFLVDSISAGCAADVAFDEAYISATHMQLVGLLTERMPDMKRSGQFTDAELAYTVEHVQAVFTRAYDLQGYLLWCKSARESHT